VDPLVSVVEITIPNLGLELHHDPDGDGVYERQ
jgi:hypothetical protein